MWTLVGIVASTGIFSNIVKLPTVKLIHILACIEISLSIGLMFRVAVLWVELTIHNYNTKALITYSGLVSFIVCSSLIFGGGEAFLECVWVWKGSGAKIAYWEDYTWGIVEILGLMILHATASYIRMKELGAMNTWLGKYIIEKGYMTEEQLDTILKLQRTDRRKEFQNE